MRMRLATLCVVSVAISLTVESALAEQEGAQEPLDIGSRLELFVDDYLIESMDGVRLKLHRPRSAGKVLSFDKPWEGVTSAYATVFRDEDHYRMYYRGSSDPDSTATSLLAEGEVVPEGHPSLTCMAESRDGIVWTRPSLGLYEFNGSKENNIVLTGSSSCCFAPFKDPNPDAPASERYKAVDTSHVGGKPVLMGFVSGDGKSWKPASDEPLLTDGAFDSLNVVFWDSVRGEYVAIYRKGRYGVRSIRSSSTRDFRNWPAGQWCEFGDSPAEHLYTNATTPYFRAPHIYLAFPRRFLPWQTLPLYQDLIAPGASDAVLMSSRDGIHWDRRFLEAFIRPGLNVRNWAHRANTPAWGLLHTASDEISLYVQRHYTFPSIHVERFAIRADGFVSVNARYSGGELVTKALRFQGDNLILNFATSAAGSIRLEIQDPQGNPLPGFALEESPLIWGDEIEHTVRWERSHAGAASEKPLARIAGKPVRLRFVMKDADLYSLRFK